jgi:hypothetical protein
MAELPFIVTAESRNIHTVDLTANGFTDEWWFLLSSDRHFDNPHSNHDLQRKHLDEVVARNAGWCDFGDLHCAMEGKFDPRRNKAGIREEHAMAPDYLDSLVRHASDFFTPYARNCVVIGKGNHETAVLKNVETDLTERLCERMTEKSGHKVYAGGYGGWIRFRTQIRHQQHSMMLKYFHGTGGAPLMSHGTLTIRRQAAVTPDADVCVQGHIHKQWFMGMPRERLVCDKSGCRVVQDIQYHIRCGTYKDEFQDGYAGYHVENARTPEMQGAVWMRLRFEKGSHRGANGQMRMNYRLAPEFFFAH